LSDHVLYALAVEANDPAEGFAYLIMSFFYAGKSKVWFVPGPLRCLDHFKGTLKKWNSS